MSWQTLQACVVKELRLLSRDVHGLALLFVMPAVFILIMSLAMQEQFAARAGKKIGVLVIDHDRSDASRDLLTRIGNSGAFRITEVNDSPAASMQSLLHTEGQLFGLVLAAGYGERLLQSDVAENESEQQRDSSEQPILIIDVAPDAAKQTQQLFVAAIREALGRQRVDTLLGALQATEHEVPNAAKLNSGSLDGQLAVRYGYGDGITPPTAVQQNVPAWLVFAVFFVVIPVSNAVIRERQMGTLRRLRTTRVNELTLLLGKLLPYYAINQLQVLVMLLIGVYVVPLLGGDALVINVTNFQSLLALIVIASAVSIAALGYALLIAVIANTTEQATVLGGAGNIVLAAIGGIMVPKFIMPAAMQQLASVSPMSWGLDGFLDVLLRGGNVQSVLPESLSLIALGIVALLIAGAVQARAND